MRRRMGNNELIQELTAFLEDTRFFDMYPSRQTLKSFLADSTSNSDKIRAILRDEFVQRELFPDYETWKETVVDPVDHYLAVRIDYK